MKVKMESGVPNWNEVRRKIERLYDSELIEVPPEYVEKRKDDWMTAYVNYKDFDEKLTILGIDCKPEYKSEGNKNKPLVRIIGDNLLSGDWYSPNFSVKEYIFGRSTETPFTGTFYYISIKPDGVSDKRDTGIWLVRNIDTEILPSRVWFYVRKLDDEIQISKLGIPKIAVIEYEREEIFNEVWF